MTTIQRVTVALLGAAAIGCGAGPDRAVAPNGGFDSSPLMARNGAQQRVTGHANVFLPSFQAEQKYSNSAIRHADGSVSGEFQLKSEQDAGLGIHGNVLCFTIVANTARLGGVIERSTDPAIPSGTEVVWTIIDNGEGNDDPPDLTSDFFTSGPGGAQFHCRVGFNLGAFLPVLGGNLQVHQ